MSGRRPTVTEVASIDAAGGSYSRIAGEHAALRKIAARVAEGSPAADVFAAVAEAVVGALDLPAVVIVRYEPERSIRVVASIGSPAFPTGSRWSLDGISVAALVHDTRRPARVEDYSSLSGEIAEQVRAPGFPRVGVPITVDGAVWGAIIARAFEKRPFPADIDTRLARFTDLVAAAIASAESRNSLRLLADEQAALHRVAALVAHAAPPAEVFAAVSEEVGRLLDLPFTEIVRYDGDIGVVIGGSGGHPFEVGSRWPLDSPGVMAAVHRSGRAERIDDHSEMTGTVGDAARGAGFTSAIGAPIIVEGATWGVIIAISTAPAPIAGGAERRLVAFTELVAAAISNLEAREALQGLANEQAALRRLAMLVAREASSTEIFGAVTEEAARVVGVDAVGMLRFERDGAATLVAQSETPWDPPPLGTRLTLEGDNILSQVFRTRQTIRVDNWSTSTGSVTAMADSLGVRSSVATPIIVDGQLWGTMIAVTSQDAPLPAETEERIAKFSELVATAVANAESRDSLRRLADELIASRKRIVAAGDEARRRIERDLHDGTQQRLIALGFDVQRVRATLPSDLRDAGVALDRIALDLESVLEEIQELSRGLHPPLLSRRGLGPSIAALARRSPIPVVLDVDLPERPSEPIETAVYYIVSEALTNAVKHSQASSISVTVGSDGERLRATIVDDGVGGAETGLGSGLIGLADRADALGGRVDLDSPPGRGTRISIEFSSEAPR